jgi:PhzF family phenazine biosynthesis protein
VKPCCGIAVEDSAMSHTLLQIDAFTAQPFAGNPAAVCLLERPQAAAWMQAVAAEMNLAETAFLVPRDGGAADHAAERGFELRWFTPALEVALCGHATLASAHGLWELGRLAGGDAARFHTKSGLLTCRRDGEWIWMDFPARAAQPVATPAGLIESLGLPPGAKALHVARNPAAFFVVLDSEQAVRGLMPDFAALAGLCAGAASLHGAIVTARAERGAAGGYDFVSRFFAPGAGINEDPVTGSAHCALAPYWAAQLGKSALTGYQASARGGTVRVEVKGERVLLGGQAVTVLRGELV